MHSCARLVAKSVEDTSGERHYPHFSSSLAYPVHSTFVIRTTSYCRIAGMNYSRGSRRRVLRTIPESGFLNSRGRMCARSIEIFIYTAAPKITTPGRSTTAFPTWWMSNVIAVPCLRRDSLSRLARETEAV